MIHTSARACLSAIILSWLLCGPTFGTDDPEVVFLTPPETAKPGVWWHWMGCNVTREGITRDLEAFRDAGIGSATIFGMADVCTPWAAHIENSPTDGLIAFTDPWWELVKHAAAEAKRLGLDLGIHNCPGYTHSGGPWIPPELSMQDVCLSQTAVEGGKQWSGVLPRPQVAPQGRNKYPVVNKETGRLRKPVAKGRGTYYRDIVVLALPAEGVVAKEDIVDLTGRMSPEGNVRWDVPPGNWIVYRIGHTTMGSMTQPNQWEARGLECDKMSVEANEFHLKHVLGTMQRHLGDLMGTGLRHVLFDSYEAGTPTWTPRMPQEFAKRRGYDLMPFMPTFAGRVVDSERQTQQFKRDFSQTIKDLYRDVHFATVSRLLNIANLRFVCEPYGGPFDTGQVAPYIDRVMTEFWTGGRIRIAQGIVNAGDRKQHNILQAEAFTGGPQRSRWSEHPGGLKADGDRAFLAGINRLVLHHCVHQPWDDRYRPGNGMGQWGTHFGRLQTWWEPGKAWIAYLQRCQALLQWGSAANGDVKIDRNQGVSVRTLHRRNDTADVFFLVNQKDTRASARCTFDNTVGRQPELWDPLTAAMRDLADFSRTNGATQLTLEFAPRQSWFVVFRSPAKSTSGPNFPMRKPVAEITGPWEVRFDPRWGGPKRVVFSQLEDWTTRSEPRIRYFSGTATYRTTFDGAEGSQLDLGDFHHLARVRLNGKDLGVLWCPPHRVSIPRDLLEDKANELEIEITNVWANRLIGDEQEPPDCQWLPGHMKSGRYLKEFPDWFVKNQTRPSVGRYCFVTWNYFDKDSPLVPSGLLGPVRVLSEDWTGSAEKQTP